MRVALDWRESLQRTTVLTLPHEHLGFVDGAAQANQTCERKIGTLRACYREQFVIGQAVTHATTLPWPARAVKRRLASARSTGVVLSARMAPKTRIDRGIGARALARRKALGLSQAEVSRRAGYKSPGSLWKLEHGQIADPPASQLLALARALEIDPYQLFFGHMSNLS